METARLAESDNKKAGDLWRKRQMIVGIFNP